MAGVSMPVCGSWRQSQVVALWAPNLWSPLWLRICCEGPRHLFLTNHSSFCTSCINGSIGSWFAQIGWAAKALQINSQRSSLPYWIQRESDCWSVARHRGRLSYYQSSAHWFDPSSLAHFSKPPYLVCLDMKELLLLKLYWVSGPCWNSKAMSSGGSTCWLDPSP